MATRAVSGHGVAGATELGLLALADISGYTRYLAGTELDHAHDVLADLTETVIRALRPKLRLSKLEGDAAFVYAVGERVDPSMLLDTLDNCYFAFRRRVAAIDRVTTCTCTACTLIPELDLKFIAHHGAFVRRRIAGREELTGTDVILAHRLLKNAVTERTGLAAYVLYTGAAVDAMGVNPDALRFAAYHEVDGDGGAVDGWLENLAERWAEEQERRRVWVSPQAAAWQLEVELAAPRPAVWAQLTDPTLRLGWEHGTTQIDQVTVGARRGVGTTNHCMHGPDVVVEEVVDWRPFDYLTVETQVPAPDDRRIRVRITFELAESDAGTRLTQRMALLGSGRQRALAESMRDGLRSFWAASLENLRGVLSGA